MKAARIQRLGPANLITMDDLPLPEAGAGELLVRVKAAAQHENLDGTNVA